MLLTEKACGPASHGLSTPHTLARQQQRSPPARQAQTPARRQRPQLQGPRVAVRALTDLTEWERRDGSPGRDEVPLFRWEDGFHARFSLGSLLGRGAFGSVSRALEKGSGLPFAVKIVPKSREGVDPGRVLHRLREEVDVLERVQAKEEAIRLVAVFEDADKVFIVTELCQGGTLEDHLQLRGRLTEGEAARATYDILQVLAECHRKRICYGDIKPANFLLTAPGAASAEAADQAEAVPIRVVDFGCSSYVREGAPAHKHTGTPLYTAPEMFLQRAVGVESDLWGIGVLLYRMLAGVLPLFNSHDFRSPASVARAILQADVSFDGPAWEGVCPTAIDLVSRLLDRDPATRLTAEQALAHPWVLDKCGLDTSAMPRTPLACELPTPPVPSIILPP